jgi:hypothetical protein
MEPRVPHELRVAGEAPAIPRAHRHGLPARLRHHLNGAEGREARRPNKEGLTPLRHPPPPPLSA